MSPVAEESATGLRVGPAEDNLRRQPSWKRWYRPGTVCFCLRAFCLLRTAPFPLTPPHPSLPSPPSFFFHLHCLLPSSPLPSSSSAMQMVSFANVKKQVRWGKKREMEKEIHTHTHISELALLPHSFLLLFSLAHLNKLTLDICCTCACAAIQMPPGCKPVQMQLPDQRAHAQIVLAVLCRHADARWRTSSDALMHLRHVCQHNQTCLDEGKCAQLVEERQHGGV